MRYSAPVQEAMSEWANGKCLFEHVVRVILKEIPDPIGVIQLLMALTRPTASMAERRRLVINLM